MDHWFDSLTKNLASNGITRRTFLDGALAGIALASLDWRLDRVLAAQAPTTLTSSKIRFAPSVHLTSVIKENSHAFGPCAVKTKGSHFERQFKSETQVSGHTVSVRRTHTADKDQPAKLETKLEIDGKPQLVSSVTGTKNSKRYQLQIGEAFGFTALLTSDDGRTVRGTINGRAVVPFTKESTGSMKFADGKPFKAQAKPYLQDAIKAAFARANEDLKLCAAPAHAFNVRRADMTHVANRLHRSGPASPSQADPPPCYDCDNSAMMAYLPSNAVFSVRCQACLNACNSNLDDCITSNSLSAGFSFGLDVGADWCLATGCNKNDVSCITKCAAGPCLGDLCPGELQTLKSDVANGVGILAPVPSCDRNEICVNNLGFCCPKLYPTVCPGWFDQFQLGVSQASNICCQLGYACLWDNTSGYFGCCPKARTCKRQGPYPNAAYGTQGVCCPPGELCDGHGGCCPPYQMRGGACCGGTDPITKQFRMWCGGKCIVCTGQCVNGRCQHICLGGYTTEGKCCTNGNACGKKCCPYGCADAKTSTCISTPPSIAPPK